MSDTFKVTASNVADVALETVQSIAELTVQIADYVPVPGLGPAAKAVLAILALYNGITVNKKEAEYLARRCASLLPMLRDGTTGLEQNRVTVYVNKTCKTLVAIQSRFVGWKDLRRLDKVLLRADISDQIAESHRDIDGCLSGLFIVSALETNRWQQESEKRRHEDHQEVLQNMSGLLKGQLDTKEQVRELVQEGRNSRAEDGVIWDKRWEQLMGLIQQSIHMGAQNGDLKALQGMLLNVGQVTGILSPGTHLLGNGKEVRITGQYPVKTGFQFDIYKGEYLGDQEVALKVLRGIKAKDKGIRRFYREADVWRKVWEKDQGRYVVPYIGTVEDEGPYPYIVSPWQKNGSVLQFIKTRPDIDRVKMIRGIARGVEILHSWEPEAIVHGDLRADNILVSDSEEPLLTDFSLSKMIDTVAGTHFTQSQGVSDYYRWFAPEVCRDEQLSTMSDMYSFGMMMLEILTGGIPFAEEKSNTQVLFKVQGGLRPARPPENIVPQYLWVMIENCWAQDPEKRISIQQLIHQLES